MLHHSIWEPGQKKALRVTRAVNMVDGLPRACKSWQIAPKNQDISESVNSIDSEAIFPRSLGQDLSRNVPVVSVYAL